jgi:hypothetical protein
MPGAVNVRKGEATVANDDGRLPFQDKGTRVVVFGTTAQQARIVAAEIAKKAYWNSSFFGGTFDDLLAGGLINRRPVVFARNAVLAAGPACTATIHVTDVDNGSFDPDAGDAVALRVDPVGPLGPSRYEVTLTGTDMHGKSASSTALVNIVDEMAPTIGRVTFQTQVQRPRNEHFVLVTLDYSVSDNCGAVTTELMVTSRDGDDRGWQVLDAHHVLLRAGRRGRDGDDDDTIAVIATDAAGNQTVQTVMIRKRDHDR